MDLQDDSSRFGSIPATTSRNMSSSSSAFFSAVQSPFFTPRPSTCQRSESTLSDVQCDSLSFSLDPLSTTSSGPQQHDTGSALPKPSSKSCDRVSSAAGLSNSPSRYDYHVDKGYSKPREKHRKHHGWGYEIPYMEASVSISSSRLRCCDVFIGLHGRKPSLMRFVNWLRAELELQGMSCFASDRARCRNSKKHRIVERAMDVSSFGVVILTRKSFKNPYTIEELRFFSSKKNLVPIFFDLSPGDCLVRDIVERRGEIWEKHGGELWVLYGGVEKEWREVVHGLSRVDEWKLEAQDSNWRDCVFRTVTLLALKLGRRSIVERLSRWREKAERDEFPFPRNEAFVGRRKELSELEFMLFGDVTRDSSERDYIELKAARSRRRNVTIGWGRNNGSAEQKRSGNKKGKEKVVWKESAKEIEMQSTELVKWQQQQPKSVRQYAAKRRKSMKIVYGKGIACVSGGPGIGKTELLLEFAYRYYQRYKMVLWISGEGRYIRQNYLNLWSYLEVDIGVETSVEKNRVKSFEEQEEAAVHRVRRELMRNIPFLVVIDNLESEKDWWDHKSIMDLLPRFGSETHILISTTLPRVMNLEPLKLSYLSGAEAITLMQQGNAKDYSITEMDVLRIIEEKVGRLTLGLAIVGSILSELPINPSRLLDTINRMPLRDLDFSWEGSAHCNNSLRHNTFLMQLFEVCFSIFDHADGPRSLAARMVQASGYFAPAPIPITLLAAAAHKLPEKNKGKSLWRKILLSLSCGFTSSYVKRSEADAASMLLRFNLARSSTRPGCVYINNLAKLYSRRRLVQGAQAMVRAVMSRGSVSQHSEHVWAACFLLFGFGGESALVQIKPPDLLCLVKDFILPLAVRTFITFSRCTVSLELLRVCTDALEAADQALVTPVEKWLDGSSLCWQPMKTDAQLNPALWHELALVRATVLETRAKLMLRGGQFGLADDLIRKAIFIRTSINGEDHPATVSARETLSKLTRLLSNVQFHNASP